MDSVKTVAILKNPMGVRTATTYPPENTERIVDLLTLYFSQV